MPSADHKSSKATAGKRGSLTGEKTKKTSPKKKKKSSKKTTSKSDSCQNKEDILEVEELSFPKEGDDSDSSTNNKTPLFPKLSSSDITVNSENTGRVISSDSIGTSSSITGLVDSSQSRIKSDSSLTTIENLTSKLSSVSVKSKSSKSKTKAGSSKKENSAKTFNKKTSEVESSKSLSMPNIIETPSHSGPVINESIRWENELDAPDLERERIHIYKINRRKRYLAAAQDKGLGWVKQYGVNGFPINDECGMIEAKREKPVIPDFKPAHVVRNSHAIMNSEG